MQSASYDTRRIFLAFSARIGSDVLKLALSRIDRDRIMPSRVDEYFDTGTRNWRARLAISVDLMRELSRVDEPQAMYQTFTRRMEQIYPTTRQVTLSRRGVEPPQSRVTRFSLWKESPTRRQPQPVLCSDFFSELLYSTEPHIFDDLHVDDRDPAAEYLAGQQSLLAMPIFEHGEAVHSLVLTREEPAAFHPEHVPELVWMTNLFGRALQTQSLSRALRQSMVAAEEEVREIAELQQSLLPMETPPLPLLDIAAHYRPAGRAGGDYYDFFPQPDGSLGVLIADVSGHGTPAAVLMAITHSIAHSHGAPTHAPGAFLGHLNRHLAGRYNRVSASFVTAFYGMFEPTAGRVIYASAGHTPPWIVRAEGRPTPLNRVQRLPLGIDSAAGDYPEAITPFAPTDSVVLVTDGVTEAVDTGGAVFGTARLNRVIGVRPRESSETLVRVLAAVDCFAAGTPQADDRTVVVVRHRG
jgi:phosphoserine phosphatase RsbU/P